ncbi:MAG: C40 family peptidase [Proteobacteria bacterium]|nr:C40 family peptidase [Pseudomonadota bacterium]
MRRQIRPRLFYRSLICIVCSVIVAISTSQARAVESQSDSSLSSAGFSQQQFENEVKEYLGTPYRRGGASKKGFDCSGFARTVYDRFLGIDLPHSSGDQFRSLELQKINTRELQTGDLVFFANQGKKKKRINHVGVYLSDGRFIHASSSEGIIVSRLSEKYWKKRFVGSKRHVALTSAGDNNDFRFESYLQMAVHQNSALTFYSREQFNSNSPAQNDPDTINYDPFDFRDTTSASQNYREIGYNQTLFDGFDISLSAFTEKFDATTAWPEIAPDTHSTGYAFDETSATAVRQGLTLSTDYHPSSWLSVTPSVTYFDHSGENSHLTNVPKRTLGLNTQLSPLNNNWSLSMLVQYTDGENISDFDNKISSLDMAVKLGISLTENLQFSITSKQDRRSMSFMIPEDSSFNQTTSRDVAMVFDFKY